MKLLHGLGVAFVSAGALFGAPRSQDQVVAWGSNADGQCDVPELPRGRTWVELAAGAGFSLGRLDDGSVVAWGGDTQVPALPAGLTYAQLSAEYGLAAALRSDGSLVAWGYSGLVLPPEPEYVQVGVGFFHVLAIHTDGSIGAWGYNGYGQLDVPALPSGTSAVQVDGGVGHSLALLSDGSVIAWGRSSEGQCDVPGLPAGLSYVEIAAHGYFSVARRSDGTVVAWGNNLFGQLDVPAPPPGLAYVAVDAGAEYTLAILSDGSALGVGANGKGQSNVPALMAGSHYVELVGSHSHTLARIETANPCGGLVVNYCASQTNSTGQTAALLVSGSLAVPDGPTVLESIGCPPGNMGLFFYGGAPAQVPFANGTLCVSPFSPGLFRLMPPTVSDSMGHAVHAIEFDALAPSGAIGAGSTWHFQQWYRDPAAGGACSNLSSAVRVTFCP